MASVSIASPKVCLAFRLICLLPTGALQAAPQVLTCRTWNPWTAQRRRRRPRLLAPEATKNHEAHKPHKRHLVGVTKGICRGKRDAVRALRRMCVTSKARTGNGEPHSFSFRSLEKLLLGGVSGKPRQSIKLDLPIYFSNTIYLSSDVPATESAPDLAKACACHEVCTRSYPSSPSPPHPPALSELHKAIYVAALVVDGASFFFFFFFRAMVGISYFWLLPTAFSVIDTYIAFVLEGVARPFRLAIVFFWFGGCRFRCLCLGSRLYGLQKPQDFSQ